MDFIRSLSPRPFDDSLFDETMSLFPNESRWNCPRSSQAHMHSFSGILKRFHDSVSLLPSQVLQTEYNLPRVFPGRRYSSPAPALPDDHANSFLNAKKTAAQRISIYRNCVRSPDRISPGRSNSTVEKCSKRCISPALTRETLGSSSCAPCNHIFETLLI